MKLFNYLLSFFVVTFFFVSCQKEYSIENHFLQDPGSWQFENGNTKYTGNMDTVYQMAAGGTQELFLVGSTADGKEKFELHLFADSFKVGTYKASLFQSSFVYSAGTQTLYEAGQLVGEFTVQLTSVTDQSITGTFSGAATGPDGNTTGLTNGSFVANFPANTINPGSEGVLGNADGNCTPVTIFGTYGIGMPVSNTHSVQVQVTVTTPGGFSIATNTVNGVSFSQKGVFQSAGTQNVLLQATGTPEKSGTYTYTIRYGNSQCSFQLTVADNAQGTLGGEGGGCTPFEFDGTYQQGIPFNSGNTVKVKVNVTAAGVYHITTSTANGVSFSGEGIFTATGLQDVVLTGTGTPLDEGEHIFNVSFLSSACNFPLVFLPENTTEVNYFPLTQNSYWDYTLTTNNNQSVNSAIINYLPTLGGQQYSTMRIVTGGTDSIYYRKDGGNYFEYLDLGAVLGFDQYIGTEFIFLKDNAGVSETWNSPVINGTIGGNAASAYIRMTILEKSVMVTSIPDFVFPDVIKVKYEYFINNQPSPVMTQERWFARNAGEIYFSMQNSAGTASYQLSGYKAFP